MTGRSLAMALAAALFALVAAQADAQNAPPKSKLKPKAQEAAGAVTVMVTNTRKSDLVQLQAAESGSPVWKKVLGGLKAGKQAPAQLPQPFNCRVNLHGVFADGQPMDASDFNVCSEKTINLTD